MRSTISFGVVASCLIVTPLVGGCKKNEPPPPEKPLVQVSYPVERDVTDYYEFQGRTTSLFSVDVKAQVTGYLKAIYFREGSEVVGANQAPLFASATLGMLAPLNNPGPLQIVFSMQIPRSTYGDPLYQIDPDLYLAQLAKAEADIESGKAAVTTSKAAYEIEVNAKEGSSELARNQKFGQYQQALAQQMMAKASLSKATKDLGFCSIYAPISGQIGSYLVTAGNLVTANQTSLTNIVTVSSMWVEFDVDDATMLAIKEEVRSGRLKGYSEKQIPVTLGLVIDKGKFPHKGVIDFVANQVKATTGTITVRAKFDNPLSVNNTRMLTPGLFCRIRLALGESKKTLMVAEKAMGQTQGQRFVYIVNDKNEADIRAVQVGRPDAGMRPIYAGLQKTDKVIVNGLMNVRPGLVVEAAVVPMPEVIQPQKDDKSKVGVSK